MHQAASVRTARSSSIGLLPDRTNSSTSFRRAMTRQIRTMTRLRTNRICTTGSAWITAFTSASCTENSV